MKSCRTCGTRIHLNVLPSSIQSLYKTPSSLMNIFCNSISLCNFFATFLQYSSFICSCCRRVVTLHRWMWKQWLLRLLLWIYSCSMPLCLNWCVSSAGRYWIVFDKFLIPTTSLRGMCVRDAKFAPCVNLTITSSVSPFTRSGTKAVVFFLLYWQL